MTTRIPSEMELTEQNNDNNKITYNNDKSCNGVDNNKKGDEVRVLTLVTEKVKQFLNFFTVEPFLFCYIFPNIISSVAVQRLNMEKACRADLNYTEYICSQAIAGNFSENITIIALDDAQELVAKMTAWKQPIQSGIPAIAILFIGAWSDKTGNRKLLMLIPILGEIISAIALILTTYYFLEWPLWVTGLIEAVPSAFTGGFSIALMGAYSYIADVTTLENRTFRMGCLAVIVTLGIPLGSSISGILTKLVGYYGIFGIGAVLYTLGFIQTFFRVHDIRSEPIQGTFVEKVLHFFNPLNAWETLSILLEPFTKKLIPIWLVVWAHIVIVGPVFGESSVLFLYTLKKFNMDVVDFSLFSTYSVLMGLAGTAIAIAVFIKIFKMHDAIIGVIATTSKVLSSLVYGLAPTRNWFFAGPVFDIFGNCGSTVVRSLGTKVVNPEQIGKMCSLIGFVEALVPVLYTPLYSLVYSSTLKSFSGTFYLLGGLMTLPAVFIFFVRAKRWSMVAFYGIVTISCRMLMSKLSNPYLYYISKKDPTLSQTLKNPDSSSKETYAYDNPVDVTTF